MGRANILCKREVNGNAQRISGSIIGDASIQSLQTYLFQTAVKINTFDPTNAATTLPVVISLGGEGSSNKTVQGIRNIKITMHAKRYLSSSVISIPTDACISAEGIGVDEVLTILKNKFDSVFGVSSGNRYYIKLFTYYIETEDN